MRYPIAVQHGQATRTARGAYSSVLGEGLAWPNVIADGEAK